MHKDLKFPNCINMSKDHSHDMIITSRFFQLYLFVSAHYGHV